MKIYTKKDDYISFLFLVILTAIVGLYLGYFYTIGFMAFLRGLFVGYSSILIFLLFYFLNKEKREDLK